MHRFFMQEKFVQTVSPDKSVLITRLDIQLTVSGEVRQSMNVEVLEENWK